MTGPQGEETPWWQQMRRPTPTPPPYAPPQYAPQYTPHYAPQYTPPQYPPQYAPPPPSRPGHSTRWLLIGGAVLVGAIAAAVVAVALLWFGAFGGHVLNVSKAEQAVKQVITDPVTGYGVAGVTDVKCNNGRNPAAKKGAGFTCEVTVAGKKHQVRAVFIDDNGTYEVDRPR
jgi:Domain of unknown function (DUF4333)